MTRRKSPVDKAKGYEIDWPQVAPVFEAVRHMADVSFVYFIGEPDDGPFKIGVSKDPITRLRAMQTGNPRRIRIEHLLVGDAHAEKLLHEIWEKYAILSARNGGKVDAAPGTEWFNASARERILPVIRTAAERQLALVAENDPELGYNQLEDAIRRAHGDHDVTMFKRHTVTQLAVGGGTTVTSRRSRI